MKRLEPKTAADLSRLDAAVSEDLDNDVLTSGTEPQGALQEIPAHAETVAQMRLLWAARGFLARVIGAGMLISVLVALLLPNRYQSTARLMPPDNQSGSGLSMAVAALSGGMGNLGGLASEVLGMKSNSDLLVGVLSSRTVADQLIQKFNLSKLYGHSRMEDTRKELAANTDASVDRKSQIITITVTDKDPHRAQAMAESYVEELNRLVAEVSTSSARRERIFLEGRLNAVNQDLEVAEKEFSQFASKNEAIDIKEQGKAMVEAAATLQGQLIAVRSELEGLRQIYSDNNVRVRSVQARVAELENQLRKVGGLDESGSSQSPKSDDALYPSIRKLPLLGVTYADLYRRTKVQEVVLETLTQEYEMAKVQEAKEIPSVKVLDSPNLPDKKSFPPRTLIALLGTALVFSCGIAWVLGRAMWEGINPADPGKVFALEVFETVKAAVPWTARNGFKDSVGPEGKVRNPGHDSETGNR